MTPKRKPTKPRTKVVKGWALRFSSDGSLFPTGRIPLLYETKKDALEFANLHSFRERDELQAEPVRVLISIAPTKGKRR